MAHDLMDSTDILLPMSQLMHAAALNVCLMPCIYLGASVALLPGFDPAAVLDAIEQFRCTAVVGLPTLMQFVVEEAWKPRLTGSSRTALRGGDTGGASGSFRNALRDTPSRDLWHDLW